MASKHSLYYTVVQVLWFAVSFLSLFLRSTCNGGRQFGFKDGVRVLFPVFFEFNECLSAKTKLCVKKSPQPLKTLLFIRYCFIVGSQTIQHACWKDKKSSGYSSCKFMVRTKLKFYEYKIKVVVVNTMTLLSINLPSGTKNIVLQTIL